jgi:superoxide dismutase, Fe-Mn family
MTHELPKLPYDFNTLEPIIDAKTMEIHHGKHHAGYVTKLNAALETHADLKDKPITDILKDIDSIPEDIRTAVINNGGGHANHSLFWEIMGPQSESGKPSEKLLEAMKKAFGSGEECHKKFMAAATTRFGSGWAWLIVNKDKELEILSTPNQDSPLMDGNTPILGLDVWEHAYYLNYQNKRPDYVEAFTKLINWKKVDELFEAALV